MNLTKVFVKRVNASSERLSLKVRAFRARPNAINVHDVRTSIRRTQASFALLPKKIRKKLIVSNYLARTKSLFKATSPIRDIDIVGGKLRKFEAIAGIPDLLKTNEGRRAQLLRGAMRSADILGKTPIPRIKPNQVSESRLIRRRKKIEKKFENSLHDQLAGVLSSPKPEPLHAFRKTCKMFRYTLELDPNKKKKQETMLKYLQIDLGSVLDDYMTLECLSPLEGVISPIAIKLDAERDKNYIKFANRARREFGQKVKKPSNNQHARKAA